MKILVLTKNYGDGYTGATSATYNLIDHWEKKGLEVEVVTLNIVGKTNGSIFHEFTNIFQLLRFLRGHKTDYIGYSDDHLGFLFRLFGIHYIHTYHGNWPDAMFIDGVKGLIKGIYFIPLYAATLHLSDYVINVSKYMTKFTKKFNNKTKVIYNGVDVSGKVVKKEICFQNKLQKPIKIIMVGSIDQRKYEGLVELLKIMSPDELSKLRLDVYGKVHDIKFGALLQKFECVHIMGFAESIPYNQYDIFLSTSVSENLPISAVESIVSGTPVIALNVGGFSEIVENLFTGVLVDRGDYEGLRSALLNIYNGDVKINFSNEHALNEFSWKKASDNYVDVFKLVKK